MLQLSYMIIFTIRWLCKRSCTQKPFDTPRMQVLRSSGGLAVLRELGTWLMCDVDELFLVVYSPSPGNESHTMTEVLLVGVHSIPWRFHYKYGISIQHFVSPSRNRWKWSCRSFVCLLRCQMIGSNLGHNFIAIVTHWTRENICVDVWMRHARTPNASRKNEIRHNSRQSPTLQHVRSSMLSCPGNCFSYLLPVVDLSARRNHGRVGFIIHDHVGSPHWHVGCRPWCQWHEYLIVITSWCFCH